MVDLTVPKPYPARMPSRNGVEVVLDADHLELVNALVGHLERLYGPALGKVNRSQAIRWAIKNTAENLGLQKKVKKATRGA